MIQSIPGIYFREAGWDCRWDGTSATLYAYVTPASTDPLFNPDGHTWDVWHGDDEAGDHEGSFNSLIEACARVDALAS